MDWRLPGFMWQTFPAAYVIINNMKLSKYRNMSVKTMKILRNRWGTCLRDAGRWGHNFNCDWWEPSLEIVHDEKSTVLLPGYHGLYCLTWDKLPFNKLNLRKDPGMHLFLTNKNKKSQAKKINHKKISDDVKSPKRFCETCTEYI